MLNGPQSVAHSERIENVLLTLAWHVVWLTINLLQGLLHVHGSDFGTRATREQHPFLVVISETLVIVVI